MRLLHLMRLNGSVSLSGRQQCYSM
jgi:hypothetical protein